MDDYKENKLNHAGYWISLIKKELDRKKNNDIKEYNITHTQFQIIMFLFANEDKMVFQKDIEKELEISAATASGLIARLESNGFIKRTALKDDSRYKFLTLCPKSYELHEVVKSRCKKGEESIFKDFTDDEKAELILYLKRILKNVKEN